MVQEHGQLFVWTVRTIEGLCRLAGEEELAALIRPSGRRPGRRAVEVAEEEAAKQESAGQPSDQPASDQQAADSSASDGRREAAWTLASLISCKLDLEAGQTVVCPRRNA